MGHLLYELIQAQQGEADGAEIHPEPEDFASGKKVYSPEQAACEEHADQPDALKAQRRKAKAVYV